MNDISIYNKQKLQQLAPFTVRKSTIHPDDLDLYIAEYTLTGQLYFSVICQSLQAQITGADAATESDQIQSNEIEQYLLNQYNSPAIQAKYLMYNMIRQDKQLLQVQTDPSVFIQYDEFPTAKQVVNHLMGPPPIQNTSPVVRVLSLMFCKQLHVQYTFYTQFYRTAVLLQTIKPDSLTYQIILCMMHNERPVNLDRQRNVRKAVEDLYQQPIVNIKKSTADGYTTDFSYLFEIFQMYWEWLSDVKTKQGIDLIEIIKMIPNPCLQVVVYMVENDESPRTPQFVRNSIEFFGQNVIRDVSSNALDSQCIKQFYNIFANVENIIDVLDNEGPEFFEQWVFEKMQKINESVKLYSKIYNYYSKKLVDYHALLKLHRKDNNHLRTADAQQSVNFIFHS